MGRVGQAACSCDPRAGARGGARACRLPDRSPPPSIEGPGTTGRRDRLRARFSGAGQCGPVACVNPQTSAVLGACGRVYRRSAATVDHKNRIRRHDRRARLPHRHGKVAFEQTILLAPFCSEHALEAARRDPTSAAHARVLVEQHARGADERTVDHDGPPDWPRARTALPFEWLLFASPTLSIDLIVHTAGMPAADTSRLHREPDSGPAPQPTLSSLGLHAHRSAHPAAGIDIAPLAVERGGAARLLIGKTQECRIRQLIGNVGIQVRAQSDQRISERPPPSTAWKLRIQYEDIHQPLH